MKTLILAILVTFTHAALAYKSAPEPVGYYSNGSLKNGVKLPDSGPGYMKLFLERNRAWGTQEMIDMLTRASASMNQKFQGLDRLQVGDISKRNGGIVSDLHNSHQNGLDADLTYFRMNHVEQKPSQTNGFSENMVINGRLSKNFDGVRTWEFIKKLHENGDVQRIFVDPLIKKELCRVARMKKQLVKYDEILRSLRPYENHADHMHVRIKCPKNARSCDSQEDPPEGSGCAMLRNEL